MKTALEIYAIVAFLYFTLLVVFFTDPWRGVDFKEFLQCLFSAILWPVCVVLVFLLG